MLCVIFGPPGSGKGTQASALCERYGMTHVSTGDMLREAVSKGSDLGRQAQSIMADGKLVPDELVGGIVREKIAQLIDDGQGILFDGYPRNLDQAQFLDTALNELHTAVDHVPVLEIPREELVKRIRGRRLCSNPDCDGSYNIHYMPPEKPGICDKCGQELIQRKDDNEDTLRRRLDIYDQQTLPILQHYQEKNLLIRIRANGRVDQVRDTLIEGIAEARN